jgi:large subunit ribosomal protein L23
MKVLLAPVVSEKSTLMADASRQFAFKVVPDASKPEIRAAVKELFQVEVDSVRVVNVKGKQKRRGAILGQRPNWKKAYVKLMPGQDIDFGGGA